MNKHNSFLWGVSTAAHQIEGNNIHSDWWQFEQQDLLAGGPSGKACNSYELWNKDHEWVEKLGLNAYRFSIEWCRLEPERGRWNESEVDHYFERLSDLKSRNVTVMVTLHHFVNPSWFLELDGWTVQENLKFFLRYVEKVVSRFGNLVDYWVVLNEPQTYLAWAYVFGKRPPLEQNLWRAWKVQQNFVLAQKLAYERIHSLIPDAMVGSSEQSMLFVHNQNHNLFLKKTVSLLNTWKNEWWWKQTHQYNDFLGLNYYAKVMLSWQWHWVVNLVRRQPIEFPMQEHELLSEVIRLPADSIGLSQSVKALAHWGKPIIITENGFEHSNDELRQRFLREHLQVVKDLVGKGYDLRGYFYWSLLDNFEWSYGFEPKFGLLEVDRKTFERRPKESAWLYRDLIAGYKKDGMI